MVASVDLMVVDSLTDDAKSSTLLANAYSAL